MFGKTQWFRPKTVGWGLVPVTWQGWLYTGIWGGATTLPFLLLLGRHQPLEAMIWVGLMIGGLIFDVWHILRAYRTSVSATAAVKKQPDNVLYIMDSQPCQATATRNYQLHARR